MIGIPRIPGRTEGLRFRHPHQTQFGKVRLAEDDQSRPPEPLHDDGVFGGHEILQGPAPAAHGNPRPRMEYILEQEGHAGEGTGGDRRDGGLPGQFIHGDDHGVEARIPAFDPADRLFTEFGRAHLAFADEHRQTEAVVPVIFRKSSH
jgi:hypothetical protein